MDQGKKIQIRQKLFNVLFVLGILVFALMIFADRDSALALKSNGLSNVIDKSLDSETSVSTTYLPIVFKNYPKPLSIFGVEINFKNVLNTVDFAEAANVSWTRYNGIVWHEVEPVSVDNPDDYDWSKLSTFEAEILALQEKGIEPMVIIRGTPEWARLDAYPNLACGPIRQDALDDFATFVADMVRKYSQQPYNIKYWELGNEPDVHPEASIYPNMPFGCWGNVNDPYYGGGWYADMLKVVYPAIKQVNPQAKVVLGGLLLICDPAEPGKEEQCLAAKYLEGILRNGGGDFIDIIAYHAYPFWYDGMDNVDWDLTQHHWDHRGGTLIGKLGFIQEVMGRYNVQKPIIMNEGGVMCGYPYDSPNNHLCYTDAYEQAKSNYVIRMYARTGSIDIMGSAWYTLNGPAWRNGGLLDGVNPRPAYDTLSFLANILNDAKFSRQIDNGTLESYEYINSDTGKTFQLYWSNTDQTFSVSLPSKTIAVYDRYGNVQTTGTTISVGFDPIIIEIAR